MNPAEPLFTIAWRNLATHRTGMGTKQLPELEAKALAAELNADYPGFEHVPTRIGATPVFPSQTPFPDTQP